MNAAGRTQQRPPRGVSFFGAAEDSVAPPAFYGGILLCTILRWQLLQGKAEDALFEMQKGFLTALHDEAVENVAHGEQKFFEKAGFVHRLIFLLCLQHTFVVLLIFDLTKAARIAFVRIVYRSNSPESTKSGEFVR